MEVEAIVYQSHAGTTRRYAQALAGMSGLPAVPLKQAKKSLKGRPVLLMSWICSGLLMNYERARRDLDVKGVCAVGIGTEEMARADLEHHQGMAGMALFFLPGAFEMKRLGLLQRRTMKDMEHALAMRIRDPKRVTSADREAYDMLKKGADHYDETKLEPVLRWIRDGSSI